VFRLIRLAFVCVLVYGAFLLGGVMEDRATLSEDVVRLHVVAASDAEADQAVKLQIRDAVVEELSGAMEGMTTVTEVKEYLQAHLGDIEQIANQVLERAGFPDTVRVSLEKEAFDTRVYDTFTLPAGVYEALRIVVGEGEGQNWWCVVFPRLCMSATGDEFAAAAVGGGFSDTLTGTVSNEKGYEVRFFILDCLGRLQNLLHRE